MRECIYCGRSLEKGEVCTCAVSVAKRRERAEREGENCTETKKSAQKQEEKARAKEEKARVKQDKKRLKAEAAQRRKQARAGAKRMVSKNVFVNIWRNIKLFLQAPGEIIANPLGMGKAETLILAAFEGCITGLCAYSIITGASRGPLRLMGNLFGFKGMAGYHIVLGWVSSAFSGILFGIAAFMLYTFVFYAISKWIFRMFTSYWDFAKRLVFAAFPVSVIGAISVLLGFFSQITFVTLLLCGFGAAIAITYEILRTMWSSKSTAKTLYGMMGGLFLFLTVIMYIMRISLI